MFGIKNTPLTPTPADPFKGDKLKRDEDIKRLTEYTDLIRKPFVLTLNSPWGSGKTSYVRMWQAYLQSDQIVGGPRASVFFNSWKHDFSGVPIVSLMAEIQAEVDRYAKTLKAAEKKTILERLKAFKEKTTHFLSKHKRTLTKLGLYGSAVASEIACPGTGGAIVSAETAITSAVDSHGQNKSELDFLRDDLKKLVESVRGGENEPPLYIFIDELDRCRPTYAIEFLETAKHLFDVEGVLFVLSTDRTQLGNTVKSLYGNIDEDGYLRRFIDLEYNLPEPSKKDYITFLSEEIFNIKSVFIGPSYTTGIDDYNEWTATYTYISEWLNMSLRDIEKTFIAGSNLFRHMYKDHNNYWPEPFILYAAIKIMDNELYLKIKMDMPEIFNYSDSPPTLNTKIKLRYSKHYNYYSSWISKCIDNKKGGDVIFPKTEDPHDSKALFFRRFTKYYKSTVHNYIIKSLDFTDNFNLTLLSE
ncbi:P-loop NTPase fold protein [Maridesulfovibrio sp.]|uniref:KAP family P-loop NTPase fold protein n=1 Tax=Maridesulfovibrio sp. TaxID=2795000 RepID=UPI002AA672DB|nr:P-loop NTPase fold protein [Maridesulfovibrio sp.]